MKNKKTKTVISWLFLGFFLVFFGFSDAMADTVKCSSHNGEEEQCKTNVDCVWSSAYTKDGGDEVAGECHVAAATCRSVNDMDSTDMVKLCRDYDCVWDNADDKCRPDKALCIGRTRAGCRWDSDCRWFNDACMFRADKRSEKAHDEVVGICLCDGEKGKVPVWQTTDGCKSKRNDFWQEDIPSSCVQPLDNDSIYVFCEANASLLSPYGKDKCNRAITQVIKADEKVCLDDSERRYQTSLKDAEAREQRRYDDELCRAGSDELYPGAVFSGGGLRGGAIEAHRKLTKSISHETDLKVLVVGWMTFALELTALIAVVALVWAGILYVTDMGDGGNQEKAKKIIVWVAIGILLILGSYAIVNTLMKADLGDEGRVQISTTFLS